MTLWKNLQLLMMLWIHYKRVKRNTDLKLATLIINAQVFLPLIEKPSHNPSSQYSNLIKESFYYRPTVLTVIHLNQISTLWDKVLNHISHLSTKHLMELSVKVNSKENTPLDWLICKIAILKAIWRPRIGIMAPLLPATINFISSRELLFLILLNVLLKLPLQKN